jgi:RNA-directed DNA polymerase
MCGSREQAEQVKQRLAVWLAPRGLRINEDKTRIVFLEDGFDFLGATRSRTVRVSALEGGLGVVTAT